MVDRRKCYESFHAFLEKLEELTIKPEKKHLELFMSDGRKLKLEVEIKEEIESNVLELRPKS